MLLRPHYNVIMNGLEVAGEKIEVPADTSKSGENSGTIIDSGSTLAYLPDELLKPLMQKVYNMFLNNSFSVDFKTLTCY